MFSRRTRRGPRKMRLPDRSQQAGHEYLNASTSFRFSFFLLSSFAALPLRAKLSDAAGEGGELPAVARRGRAGPVVSDVGDGARDTVVPAPPAAGHAVSLVCERPVADILFLRSPTLGDELFRAAKPARAGTRGGRSALRVHTCPRGNCIVRMSCYSIPH